MKNNKLIPLGSVVRLKSAKQKLLVIGRAINVARGEKTYFFDYGAVLYPQGLINDQMAYFNNSDIEDIYFLGYNDESSSAITDAIDLYVAEHPEIERCSVSQWNDENE